MNPEHRAKAESEASIDLAKTAKHLLDDIHDELLRKDRDPIVNIVHAQKRISSLTVKNAESSDLLAQENLNLQRRVADLTKDIHGMTAWLKYLTIAMAVFTLIPTIRPAVKIFNFLTGSHYLVGGQPEPNKTVKSEYIEAYHESHPYLSSSEKIHSEQGAAANR